MVTKVNSEMLEQKVVKDVNLAGDTLSFLCTDNTSIQVNLSGMPALAPIATMLTKLATIQSYIAAHP